MPLLALDTAATKQRMEELAWVDEASVARMLPDGVHIRLLERHGPLPAAVCQVDGGRWLTLEGTATVTADPPRCAEGWVPCELSSPPAATRTCPCRSCA